MQIKKIIPFILLFALTACSNTEQQGTEQKKTTRQTSVETNRTIATTATGEKTQAGMADKEALMMEAKSPAPALSMSVANAPAFQPQPEWNRESYNALKEHGFISTTNDPLSTFSIDVDTASYSNVRRFINKGKLPPKGAVRIEELINYFSYTYQPDDEHPFSVTTEVGPCPWNDSRKLVRIGLKAKDIDKKDLPPSNLVFLIDVSGSMSSPNKLPLLQKSLKMLVKQMGRNDRISLGRKACSAS
ncbi:MAG: hypothetical protein D3910_27435 [Candidatus Electrothrix sp. ATG2]|nr:hypothetical protein [Candidatus Electrothrix sp. ATG2]